MPAARRLGAGLHCPAMLDPELVRRAQAGELDAFDAIVRGLQAPLLRVCGRLLGSAEDAEEVVQEALVRLHAALPRLDVSRDIYFYARRIAVNEAMDFAASRRRRTAEPLPEVDLPAREAGPERRALSGEIQARVLAALDALTPRERAAFVLRALEEEPFARVAEAMDIEEVSARRLYGLARKRLMTLLAGLRDERDDPPPGASLSE